MRLFFIVFLLIANFFILNMFVGVIVESFQMSSDPDQARKDNIIKVRNERRAIKEQERYDYCLKVYRLSNNWIDRQVHCGPEPEPRPEPKRAP